MKFIILRKINKRFKEIPRICPLCDNCLLEPEESCLPYCKKCGIQFGFEPGSSFLKQFWKIDTIEIMSIKEKKGANK